MVVVVKEEEEEEEVCTPAALGPVPTAVAICTIEWLGHFMHMYMRKGLGIFLENCEKLAATRD